MPPIDTQLRDRIAAHASRHRGFVTWSDLVQLGVGSGTMHALVRSRFLIRWLPQVWAVGNVPGDDRAWWDAVVASVGGTSGISLIPAATVWGVWRGQAPRLPHVTCAQGHHPILNAVIHRSRTLRPDDLVTVDGSRVTTIERTIVDIADAVPAEQVARVMYEADYRDLIDEMMLEEQIERARGRRAYRVAEDALMMRRDGSAGSRSRFEDRVDERIAQCGCRVPKRNVLVGTLRREIEVDMLWQPERIVLLVDGVPHRRAAARRADAAETRALERAGYLVFRLVEDDLDRPDTWFQERFPSAA